MYCGGLHSRLLRAFFGYGGTAEELRFVLGFPDWVFWGIVVPWAVCLAASLWFSYGYMTEEDLSQEESDPEGESESGREQADG